MTWKKRIWVELYFDFSPLMCFIMYWEKFELLCEILTVKCFGGGLNASALVLTINETW